MFITINAQNHIQTILVGDTVELRFPVQYGTIQWQFSTDSLTWSDMIGFSDSVAVFRATPNPTKRYYKARITDTSSSNGTIFYSSIVTQKIINSTMEIEIGDWFQGGIVFYKDGNGHGLIAPQNDQSDGIQWGCYGTSIRGAISYTDGTGNTKAIVASCITRPIAASVCDELVLNGYDDWFLPAKDQLDFLFQQQTVVGGFSGNVYCSSSEFNEVKRSIFNPVRHNERANWVHNFYTGKRGDANKYDISKVRCVRAF